MTYLIYIYFAINLFSAGYYFAEKVGWAQGTTEKIMAYGQVLLMVLFGSLVIGAGAIMALGWLCWDYLNKTFQLTFWFSFYLTGKYSNLNEDKLYRVNQWAKMFNSSSLKHRIARYCQRLINARNNYTFKEKEPNF